MTAQKGRPRRPVSRAEILRLPLSVNLAEAHRLLGVSRATGYRMVQDGQYPLEVLKVGSRLRVRRCDLYRWLTGTDEPEVAE